MSRKSGESHVDSAEIRALRETEFVEYERVATLKLAALQGIFASRSAGRPNSTAFYRNRGRATCTTSRSTALSMKKCIAATRTSGSGPIGRPNIATRGRREWRISPGTSRALVLFYKFLQWHIDRQLAEAQAHAIEKGMRIGLYHDLALATDRWGADLWANRHVLRRRLPGRIAARRFFSERAGLGVSASQSRRASRQWLRVVRAIDPQECPPWRSAAHRSRDALLSSVLDSRRHAGIERALMCAITPGICWAFSSSKACAEISS